MAEGFQVSHYLVTMVSFVQVIGITPFVNIFKVTNPLEPTMTVFPEFQQKLSFMTPMG